MELKDMFSKQTSFFDVDITDQTKLIEFVAENLLKENLITNKEEFVKGILKRESEMSTAMGDAIAIPHVLNPVVNKSGVAFVRVKNPIDWKADDKQPVKYIFFIFTNGADGNEHLTALGNLAGKLARSESHKILANATNFKELSKFFEEEKPEVVATPNNGFDIVAITACPTGIAHTYLAEEKLKEYAKEAGYSIKVETQGRRGNENILTQTDVDNAKIIILAHDKGLTGMSRFNNKKVIDTSTKDAIYNGPKLFENYLNDQKTTIIKGAAGDAEGVGEALTLKKFKDVKGNLLGGISRMLPFVVAGGILLGIAFLIDFAAGNSDAGGNFGTVNKGAGFFAAIGKTSMQMMIPILGAFIAYTIIGPQGLMPGMVAGLLSSSIMPFAYGDDGNWSNMFGKLLPHNLKGNESGFIGALVGGYLAALEVYGLSKLMGKFHKNLQGVRDIVFIPVLSLFAIAVTMFVMNIPLGYVMYGISQGLSYLTQHNLIALVAILIGTMMCVDMGGPINKIAYSLGVLSVGHKLITDVDADGYDAQTVIMAASMLAGMLPPLIIAFSTVLVRKAWTDKDRQAAKGNWLMGACFISEGAIPFMIKDPKRIIAVSMVGGAIIGGIVGGLQITLGAPHGGIFTFALLQANVGNMSKSLGMGIGISVVIVALIAISMVCGLVLGLWRLKDIKSGKLNIA
ncbi:fructose-specific PTS transporter subunit EIIC [Spiroplasma endosymbiont of Crioceris asparagi]|uniref:PTS fructose transporter subunit IIABC n=1 Tax=Spiroplasma endosymbiont of Crioceris asparagi TaxID=3066286 RepID=UPI0030CBC300